MPVVLLALLVIYCLIEVAQADPDRVRLVPRWLWVALIILLPGIGAIAWLVAGRPLRQQQPPRHPRAPDDDPDFLRGL
ncbi:MAG: PLD nuclease N-terminal domain-containing protein [Micropruina sp.]|uniref:PLDc N-terminal domain-containing protein n=1 Tax=Micropruina sp. TaxID=2737536 RepID=UPI0039E50374